VKNGLPNSLFDLVSTSFLFFT